MSCQPPGGWPTFHGPEAPATPSAEAVTCRIPGLRAECARTGRQPMNALRARLWFHGLGTQWV